MKRLFAITVLMLVFAARVRAGADDDYVQIYSLIEQGNSLESTRPSEALAKFTEAQTDLERFRRIYPGWNDRIVNFRLNYLASKIVILSGGKIPVAPAPANKAPQNAQNKPSSRPPAQTAPPAQPPATQTAVQFPTAVQTPTQSAPVVQTPLLVQPREVPPAVVFQPPRPAPANDLQNQITDLQNQLKRLQDDKSLLEAKLREALGARPASVDPRELAKAQEQIRTIQKENDLLRVTLSQDKQKASSPETASELAQVKHDLADTKRQLAEQTARVTQLTQENAALKSQVKILSANADELDLLRTENQTLKTLTNSKPVATASVPDAESARQLADAKARIAALEADKEVWRLEKIALQTRVKELSNQPPPAPAVFTGDSEHVKQLERERDELQNKLDAAEKQLYGRKGKVVASQVDELAGELETLRARLDVYESKAVPYSPEELALFKRPDTKITDPHAGEKSVNELPAGTVQLVSQAQQDFSNGSYLQAEQKYLEVLKHDSKNPSTLANLAAIQLEMGHYEDAEKNINAALAVAPNDAYSLSVLGNLKFREEKYDDALNALSRAAKIDPQNAEVQNFMGLALSEKGMRTAAEAAFRKAIILKPGYGGAQNNLAVFYLTQNPPSVELARWHYTKAVAAGFPRNPDMEKMLEAKEAAEPGH